MARMARDAGTWPDEQQEPAGAGRSRAVPWVATATGVVLMILAPRYGPHRDELYFVVAGHHPQWSCPDQPPLTPLLATVGGGGGGGGGGRAGGALRRAPALDVHARPGRVGGGDPPRGRCLGLGRPTVVAGRRPAARGGAGEQDAAGVPRPRPGRRARGVTAVPGAPRESVALGGRPGRRRAVGPEPPLAGHPRLAPARARCRHPGRGRRPASSSCCSGRSAATWRCAASASACATGRAWSRPSRRHTSWCSRCCSPPAASTTTPSACWWPWPQQERHARARRSRLRRPGGPGPHGSSGSRRSPDWCPCRQPCPCYRHPSMPRPRGPRSTTTSSTPSAGPPWSLRCETSSTSSRPVSSC